MSNAGSNNTLTSDFWVLDASFLKVRNVQLGYTLPEHIVKKFGSTGMRFYVSLDNPLTFKGYRKAGILKTQVITVNTIQLCQLILWA